jgi:hypothetical protein
MVSPVSPFSFFPSRPLTTQPLSAPNFGIPATATAFTGVSLETPLIPSPVPAATIQSLSDPAGFVNAQLASLMPSAATSNPFAGILPLPVSNPIGSPIAANPAIASPNIQNNAQLQQSIAKIQQDPLGADLLNTVLAKGYTIRVGDTGASGEPGVVVEGLTITNGRNGNEIIMNANASDFDKTLVHELFHAATEDDGTSQLEEGVANIVGDLVSSRINGRSPRNPFEILRETIPLYPELPFTN